MSTEARSAPRVTATLVFDLQIVIQLEADAPQFGAWVQRAELLF